MKVNHYQVEAGLFAGEYPGHPSPNVAETRLRELLERGITTFIDLTTRADAQRGLLPYEPHLAELPGGPRRHSFEIPDMDIPASPTTMREILDLIRAEIAAGSLSDRAEHAPHERRLALRGDPRLEVVARHHPREAVRFGERAERDGLCRREPLEHGGVADSC